MDRKQFDRLMEVLERLAVGIENLETRLEGIQNDHVSVMSELNRNSESISSAIYELRG